jgi:hypothetical protein
MPSEAIFSDSYSPAPTQLTQLSLQVSLPPKSHNSSQKLPDYKEVINVKKQSVSCIRNQKVNKKFDDRSAEKTKTNNVNKINLKFNPFSSVFRMCPDRGPRSKAKSSDSTSGRDTPLMKPRPCHNAEQDVPVLEIISDSGIISECKWWI